MTEVKPWWTSRTIWAGIVTALMGVLSIFGVIPMFDASIIDEIVTALMGLVAIYGRVVANKEIADFVV